MKTLGKTISAEERIQFLRQEIKKHDLLYEQSKPLLTDSEYDDLYMELVDLENEYPELYDKDSPTQKIYAVVVDGLEKVRHSQPMLSQDKIKTLENLEKFFERYTNRGSGKGKVLVQEKLDGLTIVLKYDKGNLMQAVTRGNGYVGFDVTHVIRTIKSVPNKIKFKGYLELRMEAVIPYVEFERLNKFGEYASARNLVSGTVRQLDASIAAERNLDGIVFDIIQAGDGSTDYFKDDIEALAFVKNLGFKTVETRVFDLDNPEDVEKCLQYVNTYAEAIRPTLEHEVDGLVIKFNDYELRIELGSTSKFPRWGVAFKFKSMNARTKLKTILVQIGKTGQLTPVGLFDAVEIGGAEIGRASLHNFNNIKDKDIRIGDTILVARANDVIPQIVKSFHEERKTELAVYEVPTECPFCHHQVEMIGENLYCMNNECEAQLVEKIEHFVSRNAMGIDGLGEKTVQKLFEEKILKSVVDIYRLANFKEEILKLEGFGLKSYQKLIDSAEASKTKDLSAVLYSLCIPEMGEVNSKQIAKLFDSIDAIYEELENDEEAFAAKLLAQKGFGDKMLEGFMKYFKNQDTKKMIMALKEVGVQMKSLNQNEPTIENKNMEGKVFVITGTLTKPRTEYKKMIEKNGGKVTGSVTSKTNYLVMGEEAEGKSKHTKAIELGIEIISESELINLLNM